MPFVKRLPIKQPLFISSWTRLVCGLVLFLGGCARPHLDFIPDVPQDATYHEILRLYQKEQAAFPPLRGLMEVTLAKKTRFWAKWKSSAEGIKINGFNLFGGTLFDFELQGKESVHFTTADAKGTFHGSREAFREYLVTHARSKRPLRMEWLTVIDWIARGGTPDLSLSYSTALEKQDDRFILYRFVHEEEKTRLVQKLFLERKAFRVTETFLFDAEGRVEAHIVFDHYRRLDHGMTALNRRQEAFSPPAAEERDDPNKNVFLFPFQIQIEADDFYGKVVFKELRGDTDTPVHQE